jgi:predicted metal-dependent hydrolase
MKQLKNRKYHIPGIFIFTFDLDNTIIMKSEIEDEELGRLVLHVNVHARNFIFRTKNDAIYISIPPHVTLKETKEVIEKMRDKLIASQKKIPHTLIDLNYRIEAKYFKISLVTGIHENFLAHSKLGNTEIVCPPDTDFNNEKLQIWLKRIIEEALRKNAKAILPPHLSALSAQYKLPFQEVKINSSHGRWGSCSVKKVINLSFYVLLLPQHLIDYVLLHELCHTCEMNHSDRFWTLLNSFTDGKALALRKELKKYKTSII